MALRFAFYNDFYCILFVADFQIYKIVLPLLFCEQQLNNSREPHDPYCFNDAATVSVFPSLQTYDQKFEFRPPSFPVLFSYPFKRALLATM